MSKQQEFEPNPFSAEAFAKGNNSTFGEEKRRSTWQLLTVSALAVLSLASIIIPFVPVVQRLVQMKQLVNQFTQYHQQGQDDQALLSLAKAYALAPHKKFYDAYGQVVADYLTKRVNDQVWLDPKEWQKDQNLFQQILNVPGIEQNFTGGASHETFRNFVIATQPIMLLEYAAVIADRQPLQATQIYIDMVKQGHASPRQPSHDRARKKILDIAVKNKDVLELLRQNQEGFALLKLMTAYVDMEHSLSGTPAEQKQETPTFPEAQPTQQKASLADPAPFTFFAAVRSRNLARAA